MKKLALVAVLICLALTAFVAGRRSTQYASPCGCAMAWQDHKIYQTVMTDIQYDFYVCSQTGRRFATLVNWTGGNHHNPWDVKLEEADHPALEFETEQQAKNYVEFTVARRTYTQRDCEFGTFPNAQSP